jgi:hypothetical protein
VSLASPAPTSDASVRASGGPVAAHGALVVGSTALLILCIAYPFLPGDYDALAVGISTMAQVLGAFGLLLVPLGALWLVRVNSRHSGFAVASLIAFVLVAAAVSLVALLSVGPSTGLMALVLSVVLISKGMKALRKPADEGFNPAPWYLTVIPIAITLFQLTAAVPLTEFSRSRAIANSAELINDIEAFHATHGHYPSSLQAVWKDYYPSVVGVEKFHYSARGEAYDLYFEQPRFLFDNIGTREFVVYNRFDRHFMISHTSWMLLLRPDQVERTQGWYAVHDAPAPHWKYFWFD